MTALVLDNDQLGPLIEIDIAQAVQRDLAAIDLERVAGDSQGLGGDVQEVAAEALAPYLAGVQIVELHGPAIVKRGQYRW
ncbi:hypothetical protein D3C81_1925200 [compost metagenome]